MKKFKGWKKQTFLGIGVLVLALLFCFSLNQGGEIEAATQYMIKFTGEDAGSNEDYVLRRSTIAATFADANNAIPTNATIKWESLDPDVLTIVGGSDTATATLEAKKAGEAVIKVHIDDPNTGMTTTADRKVLVGYVIDESGSEFYTIEEVDSEKSVLVLPLKKEGKYSEYNLKLIFPANVNWRTNDATVVKMGDSTDNGISNTTGKIIAEGVGKATITGRIQGSDEEEIKLDVYIGPDITLLADENPIKDDLLTVDNGELIYVGAILKGTNKTIHNRIEWVVKDAISGDIIGSSLETEKVIIAKSDYNPYLTVDARAGMYKVEIYTAGMLSANVKNVPAALFKTFNLKVKASCTDKPGINESDIYLQKGDTYDIAEVFNMTPEDFDYCFNVTGDVGQDNYTTYKAGIITAQNEGTAQLKIELKNSADAKNRLETLLGTTVDAGKVYNVELNIYNGFRLEVSKVTIAVGGEFQLKVAEEFVNMGNVVWSCDDSSVEVSQNGLIVGKKVAEEVIVKATMKLDDGRTLTADCKVKVTTTADEIKLNYSELKMQVGDTVVITADYSSSIEGINWLLTEEDVVSFEKTSPKSVTVKADNAGTTILTVVNEDNFVSAYCKITVIAPVKEISIIPSDDPLVVKLSQEDLRLKAECKTTDGKVLTDVELKWTSSNTAVAEIDPETGFVELKGAGVTIIEVKPVWNPLIASAQVTLRVLQSATDIDFEESTLELEVNEKKKLELILSPSDATAEITWETIDPKVATVKDGLVTAVGVGQTYIIAYTKNGILAKCLVIVTQTAEGVTVSPTNIRIAVGETYQATATANPANATNKAFIWTSLNPSIATVDSNGKVTGKAEGTTQITVTPPKGGTPAIIVVNVYSKATGMTLSHTSVTIIKGETFTLKPVFTPSNVTNKDVKWTSLNTGIATISDAGKIKGIKGGTTVITAVSEDGGYIATCVVTVQERITSVKLNKSTYTIGVGKTYRLKATVESNSATNPKVKWTTSNSKIVSVSKNGNIKGKKVGTATITVKVTDGTNKKATCKVRVVREVTKITLNKKVLTVVLGQTEKLKATIKPKNATIKGVTWKSENPEIAEVDGGEVIGLAVGSTKITATAKDNSGKKATCYVNVIEEVPATSIVLSAQNLTLTKGQSRKIGYSIVPHNHTDKVYFDSDNPTVATVNGSGKVYARRAGVANITITTTSGKQVTVKVTVIGLNKTKLTLEQYDTETLYVDGATSGVTWFSSNPSIATVQQGIVVGRKPGSCTIYAKVNGVNLACKVVVKKIN